MLSPYPSRSAIADLHAASLHATGYAALTAIKCRSAAHCVLYMQGQRPPGDHDATARSGGVCGDVSRLLSECDRRPVVVGIALDTSTMEQTHGVTAHVDANGLAI
ncbi:MAG: hypothetical protein DI640_03770 [Sphingomonas taxi]|uniref:Uncharacterized protein n=1 Tax=Sphingomonas taxi TaxID=1549858 RepID=A0A2W4Z7T6_9SPHN|nr:MAG: hypothetical protein DI640_03770 [Sphingomonas taxi]